MPKGKKGPSSKASSQRPSGAVTPALQPEPAAPAKPSRPTVVGINFGRSYSCVAVINKEGRPEVIANEDGERQIPNAIAFSEEQEYIGAPARQQLVRNSHNVILGSRQLLGQSYTNAKSFVPPHSAAPLVEAAGQPGYAVQTHGSSRTLTAHEASVKLLKSLLGSAEDFLGRKIEAAVFAVSPTAPEAELEALRTVAKDSEIQTLQLIPSPAAVLSAYGRLDSSGAGRPDSTALILDVGATTTSATIIALRSGLDVRLGHAAKEDLGGESIDEAFVQFLAKEFTKKTKASLDLSSNPRAAMKLRLAAEITKRSLSASASAPVSVESLAEGIDFSTTVNRTRLDLLCSKVYAEIAQVVEAALKDAKLDHVEIDEIYLAGGSTKLPSLVDRIAALFPDSVRLANTIDADEAIARGAALQASLLVPERATSLPNELPPAHVSAPLLARPIGLKGVDGSFTVLLDASTPLPARRNVEVSLSGSQTALVALYEGRRTVETVQPPAKQANGTSQNGAADDDEEEDEDDDEATKRVVLVAETRLAGLGLPASGKTAQLSLVIEADGKGTLSSSTGEKVSFGR